MLRVIILAGNDDDEAWKLNWTINDRHSAAVGSTALRASPFANRRASQTAFHEATNERLAIHWPQTKPAFSFALRTAINLKNADAKRVYGRNGPRWESREMSTDNYREGNIVRRCNFVSNAIDKNIIFIVTFLSQPQSSRDVTFFTKYNVAVERLKGNVFASF